MKSRISFRIEVNKSDESLLADYTELWLLVGAHTAVLATTPDTFLQIAATLDESGLSFLDEMLPLDVSRRLSGQVGFPGFCVGEIDRIVIAIGILIAQSTEGMAEFVYHHRQRSCSRFKCSVVR